MRARLLDKCTRENGTAVAWTVVDREHGVYRMDARRFSVAELINAQLVLRGLIMPRRVV